jgi:aquaglyceroporin related protein, other eukaryote
MATKSSSTSDSPLTTHAENNPNNYAQPYDNTPQRQSPARASQQPHAEHGAPIDHKVPQENVIQAHPDLLWSRIRHSLREPFSEFLGTFILVLFGDGAIAQVVLSGETKGTWQSICWGYGESAVPTSDM